MKLAVVGGSGVITSAIAKEALNLGWSVTTINRGKSVRGIPEGAEFICSDSHDVESMQKSLAGREWDAVVDATAFTESHMRDAINVWTDRSNRYFLISSASVYRTTPLAFPIREDSPLGSGWNYANAKMSAETALLQGVASGFPGAIVRPSHTYDETAPPLLGSWSDIARISAGLPVVVHGDGTSLRTLTHSSDLAQAFVRLLSSDRPMSGEIFHITADEVLTWNEIYRSVAAAMDKEIEIFHVASETLGVLRPEIADALLWDRANSKVFNNDKIRNWIGGWQAKVPFKDGAMAIAKSWAERTTGADRSSDWDAFVEKGRKYTLT